MKHRHLLGVLLMVGSFALGRTALAETVTPAPLYAHEELLSETAARCHNAVKFAFVRANVGPGQQDSAGFQFGVNSNVEIAAWCLPQNADHSYLVIAVASTSVRLAEETRSGFRDDVKGWLENSLNQ